MSEHGGCFYCGGGQGTFLTSGVPRVPVLDQHGRPKGAPCVAVCEKCLSKVESIR